MSHLQLIIDAKQRDLGGFSVRRFLPHAGHKMVGPFIFFDHMGPATFTPGQGINVRPHPHIHLATVTYLFAGKIQHRDSLGSNQAIEPGAINWMIAGHGIVHSERTPPALLELGSELSGIQCWVALPEKFQDVAPSFTHYPADILPVFNIDNVKIKLLLGEALGYQSPVVVHSRMFYLRVTMPPRSVLTFPLDDQEAAIYVVNGKVNIDGDRVSAFSMAILKPIAEFTIEALEETELMLLGGESVGHRHIYWNFVSSSLENIEIAKMDWLNGPGDSNSRFPSVPGDDKEFIPLPLEPKNPPGTIL